MAKLKELGFENIKVEAFTTPAWSRGAESAEVVGPWPQKLAILGLGGSAPTPAGGITAPIVVFKTYQAMLDQPPGSLTGKIAVVTQAMGRTQDGSSYGAVGVQRRAGAAEAAKRGAVGYLIRSISTDDTRLPHTGGGAAGGIPAAALSPPDAELLERLAARGRPVNVKLEMASSSTPAAPAWNISGEIRGKDRPDEVIVVGGHLDSWDPGTGAIDDAAGIAITTAAAKLAAQPGRPRRTIRVVMWGSEEQGGSSGAYAAAHKDEALKMVVAGESDGGRPDLEPERAASRRGAPRDESLLRCAAEAEGRDQPRGARFRRRRHLRHHRPGRALRGLQSGHEPLLRSAPLGGRYPGQGRSRGAVAERRGLGGLSLHGRQFRRRFPGQARAVGGGPACTGRSCALDPAGAVRHRLDMILRHADPAMSKPSAMPTSDPIQPQRS